MKMFQVRLGIELCLHLVTKMNPREIFQMGWCLAVVLVAHRHDSL